MWDDAGGGCNVAVPNLPPDVLADGPRASQYTPAQPTSPSGFPRVLRVQIFAERSAAVDQLSWKS